MSITWIGYDAFFLAVVVFIAEYLSTLDKCRFKIETPFSPCGFTSTVYLTTEVSTIEGFLPVYLKDEGFEALRPNTFHSCLSAATFVVNGKRNGLRLFEEANVKTEDTLWKINNAKRDGSVFVNSSLQNKSMRYLSQCKSLLLGHGKLRKSFVESKRFETSTFAVLWHVSHSSFEYCNISVYFLLAAWVVARMPCL